MENKEFYKIMKEMGDWIGIHKFNELTIYPFGYVFYLLGMPKDSYLADYDETRDYRQIFLSWYYNLCYDNNQLDYEGKSSASRASEEMEYKATGLLRKNENLKKYIKSVRTINDFNYLREDYNLVSDLIKL